MVIYNISRTASHTSVDEFHRSDAPEFSVSESSVTQGVSAASFWPLEGGQDTAFPSGDQSTARLATKMHCRGGFSSRGSLVLGPSHHGTNQIPGVRAASRVRSKRRACPTVAFIEAKKEPAVPTVVVPLGVS